MTFKTSIACIASLSLSACAFPKEDLLGSSLRTGLDSQDIAQGNAPLENSAFEMQRAMNDHYGSSAQGLTSTPIGLISGSKTGQ